MATLAVPTTLVSYQFLTTTAKQPALQRNWISYLILSSHFSACRTFRGRREVEVAATPSKNPATQTTTPNCAWWVKSRIRRASIVVVYPTCPSARWIALPIHLSRRETARRRVYSRNWFARGTRIAVLHYKSVDKLAERDLPLNHCGK